ncbi:MAG: NADH-quinone oxidoreductase subunit M [Saprospiraceae bacterium]|nr:NADH-quinone oxidoreductase subunit M [Saprospiraceae bacterium]
MILITLLLILMGSGILAWIVASFNKSAAKWIALLALLTDLVLVSSVWLADTAAVTLGNDAHWISSVKMNWIPDFGMTFHLAMDGISLVMTALTFFLGIISVLVSWKSIEKNVGFFLFNILWLLAGITGVFLAMDMMLFYFFWEIMLVPMYFVIVIWGHEKSRYAGWKFFLFTQISGLMMLLAILGLYIYHGSQTGTYSFNYFDLLGSLPGGSLAFWIMCGFLIAFLVKLPTLPFHSWLPDAYAESPSAGSIIIAALMSKTAAYGLIRFVVPLFPESAKSIATPAILIGAAAILYGAKLAYAQRDLKRLIAFSSFSHMGFILVGVFSFSALAFQGVLMQMVAHGLSIAALFIISEFIYDRIGTFDLYKMGGFWKKMANMGGFTLVFGMASLGLPGLANFVAEFLILAGAWQYDAVLATLATLGLIVSVTYSLRILQKIFHQSPQNDMEKLADLNSREWLVLGSLTIVIIWLGLFPQNVVKVAQPAFDRLGIGQNNTNDKKLGLIDTYNGLINKGKDNNAVKEGGKLW